MTEVTLDPAVIAQLHDAKEYLKLRDSSGRVLGYFLPADKGSSVAFFGTKSPFSREEVDRRYREGAKDARPLADFWAEMRQKYPDQFQ
jgi:hypothetical protein